MTAQNTESSAPSYELNEAAQRLSLPGGEPLAEHDDDGPPEYEHTSDDPPPYTSAPQKPVISARTSQPGRLRQFLGVGGNTPKAKNRRRLWKWIGIPASVALSIVVIVIPTIIETRARQNSNGYSGYDSWSGSYATPTPTPTALPGTLLSQSRLAAVALNDGSSNGVLFYQAQSSSSDNSGAIWPRVFSFSKYGFQRPGPPIPDPSAAGTGIACRRYNKSTVSIQVAFWAANSTLVDWWLDGPGTTNTWRSGTLSGLNYTTNSPSSTTIQFEPEQQFWGSGTIAKIARLWTSDNDNGLSEHYYDTGSGRWSAKLTSLSSSHSSGGIAVQVVSSNANKSLNTTLFHTNSTGLMRYNRMDTLSDTDFNIATWKPSAWGDSQNTGLWSGSGAALTWVPVPGEPTELYLYAGGEGNTNAIRIAHINGSAINAVGAINDTSHVGINTNQMVAKDGDLVSTTGNGQTILFAGPGNGNASLAMYLVNGTEAEAQICANCL